MVVGGSKRSFCRNFLAICKDLPAVLKNDLKRVAALNEKTYDVTAELSREQADILAKANQKIREASLPEHLQGVVDEGAHEKAREKRMKLEVQLDEKVAITKSMYEILDGAIKRVDDEIGKLEEDVKEGYGVVPDYASLAPPEILPQTVAGAGGLLAAGTGALALAGLTQAQKKAAEAAAASVSGVGAGTGGVGVGLLGAAGLVGAAEVAGAGDAIGPDEPLYCVCRRIGFGEMIGCDNDDCEHGEWFHYDCVGLQKIDISFWLCPGCSADAKEKELREEKERQRLMAIQRANAANNAVKVSAVKLPEDGEEDGEEDDDQDDDQDDQDDDGGRAAATGGGGGVAGDPKIARDKADPTTASAVAVVATAPTPATSQQKAPNENDTSARTIASAAATAGPGRSEITTPVTEGAIGVGNKVAAAPGHEGVQGITLERQCVEADAAVLPKPLIAEEVGALAAGDVGMGTPALGVTGGGAVGEEKTGAVVGAVGGGMVVVGQEGIGGAQAAAGPVDVSWAGSNVVPVVGYVGGGGGVDGAVIADAAVVASATLESPPPVAVGQGGARDLMLDSDNTMQNTGAATASTGSDVNVGEDTRDT